MIRPLALALMLAGCAPEGTITYDLGGSIGEHRSQYVGWQKRGIKARIEGVCASACTEILRNKNICYAPNATFIFHGVTVGGEYSEWASRVHAAGMPPRLRAHLLETDALRSVEHHHVLTGAEIAALDNEDRTCT
jgi:hypothetical protein